MTIENIYTKLRYQPHRNIYLHSEDNEIVSWHNSKDNAIMMLMEMSKYTDYISLELIMDEYKVTMKYKKGVYENNQ